MRDAYTCNPYILGDLLIFMVQIAVCSRTDIGATYNFEGF